VAEEGLDIPNVDLVVFFEPIPSEIRTIQRRGRTGRRSMGRVVVLTMKDTMDEAYFNVARQKETKMHKALTQMGDGSVQQRREDRSQQQLDTYLASGEHELICDTRENPALLKLLSSRLTLKIVQLDVADYVVSDRVGVERKSTEDFLRSLFSNKLFEQMRALSHHYEVPVLLLEGPDLFSKHQAHASAIRSALISIMVDFRVQVMMTRDEHDSAAYLVDLVKRERKEKRRTPSMRQSKQARSLHDSQVYLLEGLPSVSSTLARRLLEHFDTVERVLTATEDELRQVQGVGPTIARSIRAVLETPVSRPQD
jgi:Fanconi anemia group M protein